MGNSCPETNQGERIWENARRIEWMNEQIHNNIDYVKGKLDGYLTDYSNLKDLEAQAKTKGDKYNGDVSNFNTEIKSLHDDITSLTDKIGNIYLNINSLNKSNDVITNSINTDKKSIIDKSYSISYFENLLLAAYLQIFDAVNAQNHALANNQGVRANIYSIDNSTYLYQQERISFYKNLNTGLFYTYYLLIVLLVYVILKLNQTTSILVKLTLFRLFVIILILFPLFGVRFERFIYNIFSILYNRFSFSNLLQGNHPPGTNYMPPVDPKARNSSLAPDVLEYNAGWVNDNGVRKLKVAFVAINSDKVTVSIHIWGSSPDVIVRSQDIKFSSDDYKKEYLFQVDATSNYNVKFLPSKDNVVGNIKEVIDVQTTDEFDSANERTS
jgi:hypothetical protein